MKEALRFAAVRSKGERRELADAVLIAVIDADHHRGRDVASQPFHGQVCVPAAGEAGRVVENVLTVEQQQKRTLSLGRAFRCSRG